MKSFLRAWCQRWSNKAEYIKNLGQELARRSNIWNLQSAFSYGQKMTEILPIKSKMTPWVVAGLLTSYCERFEPRSHFKSRFSLIVRVNVVLNRTVVVDSDSQSTTTVLFRTTLTERSSSTYFYFLLAKRPFARWLQTHYKYQNPLDSRVNAVMWSVDYSYKDAKMHKSGRVQPLLSSNINSEWTGFQTRLFFRRGQKGNTQRKPNSIIVFLFIQIIRRLKTS